VVLLYSWLLGGLVWVTKEQTGFLLAIKVILDREDIRELASVVSKDHRKDIAETGAYASQTLFEGLYGASNFRAGFVFQKNANHEIARGKVQRHNGLPANAADHSVHLNPLGDVVLLSVAQEIRVCSAHLQCFGYAYCMAAGTGFELKNARHIQRGNG
jgi:hypothetical protein